MEDQDTLLQAGEDAELILKHNSFNSMINQLVDSSFQAFCSSKPEEKEKREMSYHHYRALVDIVSTLQQRVQVKDEIVAKSADDNNPKGDE
jgi:uncharacterized protein YdcH (DUF465 family)